MVRDVFDNQAISTLRGCMGIGHVRYPTAGSSAQSEAQPFYVNSPYGITFAHNGNLINTNELRHFLDQDAHRHINTDSDTEVLLNIFADNLQQTGKFRINEEDIFAAVKDLTRQCKGAYACVAMIAGFGIVAFRDPNGIRPLGYGVRAAGEPVNGIISPQGDKQKTGLDYVFSSESVVSDALGFSDWVDVKPGECMIVTRHSVARRQVAEPAVFAPDIFEYVYFARPDSVIDGISVYRSRMSMGDTLADEVRKQLHGSNTVDVVIPVPDTSRVAALQLAQNLHIPYREGFVKNRYVGRTFIMPGQQQRRKNVRRKLNAMALEFSGKNVLLVDDSIVRGTTSKEIIQMARDAGAKNVFMASCAPAIRYSNVYGIDMPNRKELVAHGRTEQQVADYIGADKVVFQTLEGLIQSCSSLNEDIKNFDCSVFTGQYITGGVDVAYLEHLENLRADNVKHKVESVETSFTSLGCSGPMNGADDNIGLANQRPYSIKNPVEKNYESHDYYVLQSHIDSSEIEIAAIEELFGMEFVENVGELDNHHLFKIPKGHSFLIDDFHSHLHKRNNNQFRSITQQTPRHKLHKRAPVLPITESRIVAAALDINDPIFSDQWHLVNDKKSEHSINVAPVWSQGIKGQGVKVAVVDDGLDMHSKDLAPTFFAEGSWDFNDHTALPEPRLREDSHGTRCAGEIAAARNDVCGVGVAYEAQVAGIRILSTPISDADEATALNYGYQLNDIYSCSWGPPDDGRSVEAPSDLIAKAFVNGVQRGRSGKGSLFVFASGNGAASDDQCNFDGYTNSIYSITVAAISREGLHPYYSEACTANLVVTYSSGNGGTIHTTDVGTNTCTDRHGGTSAAAPIAAGIYALVLQVRPDLTWRDLQHLSVQTAEPINLEEDGWAVTAAGRMYNNAYGYGKLNTEKIVEAARNHLLVKPQAWYEGPIVHVPNATDMIGQPLSENWYESKFHLSEKRMRQHNLERLEHITTTVWIDHERRGDIEVELISPNNVKSVLAKVRRYDGAAEGLNGWKFMSTKHWDENPVGDWTIRVKDGFHPTKHGNFTAWSIGFWGEAEDASKAVDYVLPFERPKGELEDDDDDDDDDETLSTGTPSHSTSSPPTHQKPKPTDHLPDDHHQAGEEVPETSYTPTPDEGYLENSSFLLNHQTWLIGAAILGLAVVGATGTIWFIRRKKAQELARADEDSRGVYASLNPGGNDSHRMTEFPSNNGGRTRELYDAFKLADSDSEEEEEAENQDEHEYRDDDEENDNNEGDESQVLFDNDNDNGNGNDNHDETSPWDDHEQR
ncbi:hypothetical protein E3Q15_00170 [Wallemia mellicola]|nr:hypothetical protein E3Q15_00170 [Wallemia mellicola]TIC59311.1 hypothetical protein E3Q05_00384 [Wallemia mellicola]